VRAYQEIFAGLDERNTVEEMLKSVFPCEHQQMILVKHVEVFSMCPHHLLPVRYDITAGYLPGPGIRAKVLGLSKLARITKLLAARPVLQEQVVNDIANTLMRIPECRGAGCIATGEHYCMRMRGVNQSGSIVVTSALRGEFLSDSMVREEFMDFR
jgi:GTP cyclohydrolase I